MPTDVRHPLTDVRHPVGVKAPPEILPRYTGLMRFLTPALFAAAGLYVSWFNNQHTDRALVLPALDVISPSVAGDMAAQGKLTTQILLGLAAIFLVWEVVRSLRAKRADAAE